MAEQFVRQYAAFRGVDFSSDPSDVADYRVAYAENMWRDYQNGNGDMIETIPGYRTITRELESAWTEDGYTLTKSKTIYGLHQYRASIDGTIKDYIIVHIGRSLYFKDVNSSDKFVEMESGRKVDSGLSRYDVARNFMGLSHSTSVMSNNKLLIIDSNNIVTVYPNADAGKDGYASTELTASVVFPMEIPPSVIGEERTPRAFMEKAYQPITYKDGEVYEQPNIFSEYAYEMFNNRNMHPEDGHIIVNSDLTITYQLISISSAAYVYIDGVRQNGTWEGNKTYYTYYGETGKLVIHKIKTQSVDLDATEENMKNRVITVEGVLKPLFFFRSNVFPTFDQANEGISAKEAVTGCTSIAVFDGKVFLTGNPKLPNMVFFTSTDITGNNNTTYFGICNWLNTGVGMTPNVAMTASGSVMMVYKGDTVQDASVYYLSPYNTNFDYVPRFYTVTEGASGIGCIGGAFNFMDDPVFISRRGLEAIGKLMTNQERSIVHRSTNVDKRMLAEDLTKAKMAQWQGYLVIMVGSRMYLADSRAMYADEMGNTQYEWFFADGIGSYNEEDTYHRYRYMNGNIDLIKESLGDYDGTGDTGGSMIGSYEIKEGYSDEYVSDGTSISWNKFTKDGQTVKVYYTAEEETDEETQEKTTHYYLVYEDDEVIPKSDAKFFEPKEICVINDVLYFATDNGDVLCFNTDKRGEIPDSVYRDGEWVDVDYDTKADFVGVIPQEYYTFDGRRYRSGVITKTDNAGISYATKNTVNRSLVLRCGADPRTHSTTVVEVLTDRNSVFTEVDRKDTSEFTTAMTDFSALTFNTYPFAFLTYREKERKWVEKRYKIYNDAYRGILRIHSLSYRYEIGGKIK